MENTNTPYTPYTPTTAVIIGRFAILQIGHEALIKMAKAKYDRVIVLIGSANRRRNLKNPFETSVIESWIKEIDNDILVATINDYTYDENKWITQVETVVNSLAQGKITLVGHTRDESSFYLKEFPNWDFEEVPALCDDISATELRELYFKYNLGEDTVNMNDYQDVMDTIKQYVPKGVHEYLNTFTGTQAYADLAEEKRYHEAEINKFKDYPYKETLKLCCADMVLVCSGNVLLIQRKFAPGKGTWALAGGFVNGNETFEDCAIRELYEETGLTIPFKVVRNAIKAYKTFDNPKRNLGIPRITNAYYAEINPDYVGQGKFPKLPKVKGSDDAMNAKWISLSEVKNMQLFDDHADIIDYFTKSL